MYARTTAVLVFLMLLAAPAGAATYKIDGAHSSAVFKVRHMNVSNFYGTFNGIEGKIDYDPAKLGASSVEVTIAAESVDSRSPQRDKHLKSPDFLNAKQFPTITFKSKAVTGDANEFQVRGDLTLNGVTREITVSVVKTGEGKNPRSGDDMIGFETRFGVDRKAHDMDFMVGPVGQEIEFILAVEAIKQ